MAWAKESACSVGANAVPPTSVYVVSRRSAGRQREPRDVAPRRVADDPGRGKAFRASVGGKTEQTRVGLAHAFDLEMHQVSTRSAIPEARIFDS
jgi:hypothetical protein